jgi:hypothetical protein
MRRHRRRGPDRANKAAAEPERIDRRENHGPGFFPDRSCVPDAPVFAPADQAGERIAPLSKTTG